MPAGFTLRLVAGYVVASLVAVATPASAGENTLNLSPAEYKGLPKGTKVNFRTQEGVKSFVVTKNEGLEYTYKVNNSWLRRYALFGRPGTDQYTRRDPFGDSYETNFDDSNESALAGLWPLKVGNSAAIKFKSVSDGLYISYVKWKVELQVVRTEQIEVNGNAYASYVIREHGVTGKKRYQSNISAEYTATIWYNPGSGLILKRNIEDTRGDATYELVSVKFPEGTTAHALTPISDTQLIASVPTGQENQATTEESVRKQAEELARKMFEEAEAKRKAEAAIAQKAAEEALKKAEAEERRIAKQKRKEEDARIAAEAEQKRKEEEHRLAEIKRKKEEARIAAEAELKRKQEEEAKRVAAAKLAEKAAAEARKKAEAEERRIAEQKRKEEEARIAAEAERKRKEEERRLAELKLKQEEEARQLAERKRLNDELAAAKAIDAGLSGDERQFVQRGLKDHGFYDSKIDGDFGAGTRNAIKRFQAGSGERQTGYLLETQVAALIERGRSLHETEVAARLKAEEEKKELARQQAASVAQSPSQAGSADFQQKLATLKQVFDAGLLTEPEYQMQKAALLQQFLGLSVSASSQSADDQDETQWASVKDSRKIEDVKGYLTRNPTGKHLAEAKTRIKVLKKFASVRDVKFGNYHALVIGNNEYKDLPNLNTAVDDAKAVAAVLEKEYGFEVKLLLNAGRLDIVDAFDELRETLSYDDNLLIYYAGHGWLDEESGQGYWLPTDAKPNRRSRWVSNATLKDTLKTLAAKHVMVVADSCFSGTLVRGASVGIKSADYWRKMATKQTRVAITSGGLEPVADADGKSSHSPFAEAFIRSLKGNDAVMDGTTLFNKLRRPVMVATDQTPAYSDVRGAGHDGGDFLFVKKF